MRAGLLVNLSSAFVEIDELEHGLDGARRKTDFGEALVEALGNGVAPAAFGHEGVPNFDFFVGRLAAMSKSPCEEVLIGSAFESFLFESGVVDVEEAAAARIKAVRLGQAAILLPCRRQFASGAETDFVEGAAKVDDAAYLVGRAAQTKNDGWIWKGHATKKAERPGEVEQGRGWMRAGKGTRQRKDLRRVQCGHGT